MTHAFESCKTGTASNLITYEDLLGLLSAARETHLIDAVVNGEVTALLQKACEELPGIISDLQKVQGSSEDSKLLAENLLRRVSSLPLPKSILTDARIQCEVCVAVHKCQMLLHRYELTEESDSSPHNDTSSIHNLRDLRHSLVSLKQQAIENLAEASAPVQLVHDPSVLNLLAESEAQRVSRASSATALELIATVHAEISLRHWCAEVKHIWLHPTSLTAAERLFEDAAHIADLGPASMKVADTKEWAELEAEVAAAKKNSDDISILIAKFNELKSNFGSSTNADGKMEPLKDTIERWTHQAVEMEAAFNATVTKAKSAKILQTDSIAKAQDSLQQLYLVNSACQLLTTANLLMSNDNNSLQNDSPLQSIEIKELTSLANKLSAAVEKEAEGEFRLLRDLASEFSNLHHRALQWNEQAQFLQLHKVTTRQKTKSKSSTPSTETKPTLTKADLRNILGQPIARAVRTPMHETLQSLLSSAELVQQSLLTFLLSGDHGDAFDVVQLQNELLHLYSIRDKMDLLPLDLPESRVLNWVVEVLEWMKSLQIYPGSNPQQASLLPLATAKRKLLEGDPIINDVEKSVAEVLIDLKVYSMDDSVGFTGFHPSTHSLLKKSGDLYDFLSDQVEKCESLQNKVQDLSSGYASGSASGESIAHEFSLLLISPDPSIKRLLDKLRTGGEIESKEGSERSSRGKGRGPQIQAPSTEDDGIDVFVPGGSGDYWTETPEETTPSSRGADREKKKTTHSCAAKGCYKDIRPRNSAGKEPTLYCSDTCAYSSSGELLLAMLQYKDLLCLFSSAAMSSYISSGSSIPTVGTRQSSAISHDESKFSAASPAALKRLANTCKGDVLAFASQNNYVVDDIFSVAEFSETLQKNNFFLLSDSTSDDVRSTADLISTKDTPILGKRAITTSSPRDADASKKSKVVQQLISTLPKAAMSVFCKGDVPPEGFAVAQVNIASNTAHENPDLIFRHRARYVMEDFFMKQLSAMNITGALFLGSMLAFDFEEDLYRKCLSGTTLNRVEYQKQQLKLTRNLKQSHNEQLVRELILFFFFFFLSVFYFVPNVFYSIYFPLFIAQEKN